MKSRAFTSLYDLPGHLIRRAHQYAIAMFEKELRSFKVTAPQFSVLKVAELSPGMEQRELAESAWYDTGTITGILRRLEDNGLIERKRSNRSQRGRAVFLTGRGLALLRRMQPSVDRIQKRLLARLSPDERKEFLVLVSVMVGVDNSFARRTRRAAGSRSNRVNDQAAAS